MFTMFSLRKRLSIKKPRSMTASSTSSTASTTTNDSKSTSSTSPQSSHKTHGHSSPTSHKHSSHSHNATARLEDGKNDVDADESLSSGGNGKLLPDIEKNPLEEIALTAAALGILFGCAITSLLFSKCKSAGLYIIALSYFHFMEFYITAKYNPKKVHKESFIINNGSAYTLAHTFALLELAIEYYYFPDFKGSHWGIKSFGILLIVIGQTIRSLAMKTAGQSFSHLVVTKHEKEHELVTCGIYSVLRHPSYFGFFWWAVGTQLVLLNPIGLIGFVLVLWSFFDERIRYEEKFLVNFFGQRYIEYRNTTSVYIPFIN